MVQVLDHWPVSPSYSRNGFKQVAETQDFSLQAGQCYEVTRPFTFDMESWDDQENIKIIAWAQEAVHDAIGRDASIHQTAVMSWPFPVSCACSGDLDGDGAVDGGDIALFVESFLVGSAAEPCANFAGPGGQPLDTDDLAGFVARILEGSTCQ